LSARPFGRRALLAVRGARTVEHNRKAYHRYNERAAAKLGSKHFHLLALLA
jgi:hypothetical protein